MLGHPLRLIVVVAAFVSSSVGALGAMDYRQAASTRCQDYVPAADANKLGDLAEPIVKHVTAKGGFRPKENSACYILASVKTQCMIPATGTVGNAVDTLFKKKTAGRSLPFITSCGVVNWKS